MGKIQWSSQRECKGAQVGCLAHLQTGTPGGGCSSSQKPGGSMRGSLWSIPDDSGLVLSMFGGAVGSPREGNLRGFVPNEWVPAEVP